MVRRHSELQPPECQGGFLAGNGSSDYERCSAAREENKRELSELVTAALKKDEQRLNRTRLRAGN